MLPSAKRPRPTGFPEATAAAASSSSAPMTEGEGEALFYVPPVGDMCSFMREVSGLYLQASEARKSGLMFEEYVKLYAVYNMLKAISPLCGEAGCGDTLGERCVDKTLADLGRKESRIAETPMQKILRAIKTDLDAIHDPLEMKIRSIKSSSATGEGEKGSAEDVEFACQSLVTFNSESKDCKNWFNNIIGQREAKQLLKDGFVNALLYPNMFGAAARGVLFYGLPGTGKTTMAKALMNELEDLSHPPGGDGACNRFLFFAPTTDMMKGKYVGETEKRINSLFSGASRIACDQTAALGGGIMTRSIIFIDEVDSLAPGGRGGEGPQAQITASAVNTLLQVMEGVNQKDNVIVIAATNFPQSLDEAFLRRLTFQIPLGLPTEKDAFELLNLMFSRHITKRKSYEKIKGAMEEVCKKAGAGQAEEKLMGCEKKLRDNTGCGGRAANVVNIHEWKDYPEFKLLIEGKLPENSLRIIASKCVEKHYSGAEIEKLFETAIKYSGRAALKRKRFYAFTSRPADFISINCFANDQVIKKLIDAGQLVEAKPLGSRGEMSLDKFEFRRLIYDNSIMSSSVAVPASDIADEIYVARDQPPGYMKLALQFRIRIAFSGPEITQRSRISVMLILKQLKVLAGTEEAEAYNRFWRFFSGSWKLSTELAPKLDEITAGFNNFWDALQVEDIFMFYHNTDPQTGKITSIFANLMTPLRKSDQLLKVLQTKSIPVVFQYGHDKSQYLIWAILNYLSGIEYKPDIAPKVDTSWQNIDLKAVFKLEGAEAVMGTGQPLSDVCEAFLRQNSNYVNLDFASLYFSRAMQDIKASWTEESFKKFNEWRN